jgi:hypothetical protein
VDGGWGLGAGGGRGVREEQTEMWRKLCRSSAGRARRQQQQQQEQQRLRQQPFQQRGWLPFVLCGGTTVT